MLLIGNGKVITRDNTRPIIDNGCIAVDENKIIEIGSTETLKNKYKESQFIDAKGKLIMPGFINTHMHYYSTFARAWLMIVLQQSHYVTYLQVFGGDWIRY